MSRKKFNPQDLDPPRADAWSVSKKQVVCAELATAIRLYFEAADFLSAHVLASAAREIIQGLCRRQRLTAARELFLDAIRPEYQDAMVDLLNAPYNFLKHGSRDADATYDRYVPETTGMTIFEACIDFNQLYASDGGYFETTLYVAWIAHRYPTLVKTDFRELVTRNSTLKATKDTPLPDALREAHEVLEFAYSMGPRVRGMRLLRDAGAYPRELFAKAVASEARAQRD